MKKSIRELIKKNAEKINQLNDLIKKGFLNRDKDPGPWSQAGDVFNKNFDELAFPGGLERGMQLLKQYDKEAIDTAIDFLLVDPFFYRSGYIKEEILKILKKAPLQSKHIKKLKTIIITLLQKHNRREFSKYSSLAKKIADNEMIDEIQKITETTSSPEIAQRAQWMLNKIKS